MARYAGINSVGNSVAQYLEYAHPQSLAKTSPCQFKLTSSTEIAFRRHREAHVGIPHFTPHDLPWSPPVS
jgi:hypothetical protein